MSTCEPVQHAVFSIAVYIMNVDTCHIANTCLLRPVELVPRVLLLGAVTAPGIGGFRARSHELVVHAGSASISLAACALRA